MPRSGRGRIRTWQRSRALPSSPRSATGWLLISPGLGSLHRSPDLLGLTEEGASGFQITAVPRRSPLEYQAVNLSELPASLGSIPLGVGDLVALVEEGLDEGMQRHAVQHTSVARRASRGGSPPAGA
jgi:hypothetical protein